MIIGMTGTSGVRVGFGTAGGREFTGKWSNGSVYSRGTVFWHSRLAGLFCRRPFLVGKRGFDPAVPKVSIAALITTLQRASGAGRGVLLDFGAFMNLPKYPRTGTLRGRITFAALAKPG